VREKVSSHAADLAGSNDENILHMRAPYCS